MPSEEASEGLETVVAAFMGPDGKDAILASTKDALHLKPMWERLRFGSYEGVDFVGLAPGAKVNSDTLENHSRHLHSLLRLLDVPITDSPADIAVFETDVNNLEPIPIPED